MNRKEKKSHEREKSHGHKHHPKMDAQATFYSDITHSDSPLVRPVYSFGIVLMLLSGVVGIIVSTYAYKRLTKRHCDYEEVSELDVDRLLYI